MKLMEELEKKRLAREAEREALAEEVRHTEFHGT